MNEPKIRYSDEDLQEFKVLIDAKLNQAQEELNTTQQQIADLNENGFNQQGGDWYDDSTTHTDLEMLQRMLVRQQRYVQDLKNALLRIHNKTYGICSVTGVLIDKSRLRLVPHATKSDFFTTGVEENDRPIGKPIGDKVRLPGKRPTQTNGDDWESENETLEDTSYDRRKFEDDEE